MESVFGFNSNQSKKQTLPKLNGKLRSNEMSGLPVGCLQHLSLTTAGMKLTNLSNYFIETRKYVVNSKPNSAKYQPRGTSSYKVYYDLTLSYHNCKTYNTLHNIKNYI